MSMRVWSALALSFAVLPGPVSAAEVSSTWMVLGLREPNAPPVTELAAQFRKALGQEGFGRATVLSEAETKAALGAPTASVSTLITRIGDAEGDYQQFSLDAARAKFEAGLQELANVGGEEGVWESTKTARLLLGMVHLASQTRDAQVKARAEFEAILRVDPTFRPTSHSDDPIVLALIEKARLKVTREPVGQLVVSCTAPCGEGFVWVDAAPGGPVNGSPLRLPVGRYRVRVTDRRDSPRLRSFTHEVQVVSGTETKLVVDLVSEGALDLAGGPSFASPPEPERRLPIVQLVGQRARTSRLAFVWMEGTEVHLAVADTPGGAVLSHSAVRLPPDGQVGPACAALAKAALGGESGKEVASLPTSLVPPPPPAPREEGTRILPIAKWAALGVTVAVGIAGGATALVANGERNRLSEQLAGWGGAVPMSQAEQYASDRASMEDKERWGTGLLVGTAVLAVGTIGCFIADYLLAPQPAAPTAGTVRVLPNGFAVVF